MWPHYAMWYWTCTSCDNYIFDEADEGYLWEQLPPDWTCYNCGGPKSHFKLVHEVVPWKQ